MNKEYRTEEQFNEILHSMINGNWTQAAQQCVDYGFYAHDLVRFSEDLEELHYGLTIANFVELIEKATKIRCRNDSEY